MSHDMLNSVVNKHASSKIQPNLLYPDFSNLIAFSKRTGSVKLPNVNEISLQVAVLPAIWLFLVKNTDEAEEKLKIQNSAKKINTRLHVSMIKTKLKRVCNTLELRN